MATANVHARIAHLVVLTRGDIEQQGRIAEFERCVAAKLTELQKTIRLKQEDHDAGALRVLLSGRGGAYMDAMLSAEEVAQLAGNIRALAALQDVLTQEARSKGDGRDVPAKEVLEKLIAIHRETAPHHVITAEMEDARLPGEKGAALALIANELLPNAIKHGRSAVRLTLRRDAASGTLSLTVRGDGHGFPAGFDAAQAANTGLELVVSLAHWDLGGALTFGSAP